MARSRPITFLASAVAIPLAALIVVACGGGAATAAAPTTSSGGVTESSLIHRLKTCLPAGRAKPPVVLVHGAWADAPSWSGEVAVLQGAGYDVRAIANPLQDLTTDSEYVADYLKTIHGPVVLAGHSY